MQTRVYHLGNPYLTQGVSLVGEAHAADDIAALIERAASIHPSMVRVQASRGGPLLDAPAEVAIAAVRAIAAREVFFAVALRCAVEASSGDLMARACDFLDRAASDL